MKKITLSEVIKEEMKDGEFKFYFDQEKEISQIAKTIYDLRIQAQLSQEDVAKRAHTTQPVIARLESGRDSRLPSLDLLARIAHAMNKHLMLGFK